MSNLGAPGSTGSPHLMTTAVSYPLGTTTVSSVFGGIGENVSPPGPAGLGGGGFRAALAAAGAAAAPTPIAIAPNAPARNTSRRETVFTWSVKYALSDSFGTGW